MNDQTSRFDVQREIDAARILREQIASLCDGDESFIRDAIEGETNLHEIMAALVADDAADAAQIAGVEKFEAALALRKKRLSDRVKVRRALIASGLDIACLARLETPCGTVTIKKVPASVHIIEESEIPSSFWKTSDPKLDTRSILAALKGGTAVPGASLTNGGQTIQIRG